MTRDDTKVVPVGSEASVASVIAGLPGPASAPVLDEIVRLIEADAGMTASLASRWGREALAHAIADAEYARARAEENRARQIAIEADVQSAESGSLMRAIIGNTGFVACFVAEYGISLATLPFLLDIDPTTFVGMMLAAAPPTALAVFDILIAELLEEPWQRLKSSARTWRRSVLWAARVAALTAVVAGNLIMLRDVAAAREEAVRVKEGLAAVAEATEAVAAPVVVDRALINRAVLSVSIWVSIDGALFLLFGLHDARREGRRAALRLSLRRHRRRQHGLDRELQTRMAARQICQGHVDDAPRQEADIAEWTRRAHLVQLRIKQQAPQSRLTSLERVNGTLASVR